MTLTLKRYEFHEHCTLGKLSINDVFECFVLEPPVGGDDYDPKGAIGTGTYKVTLTYSNRFQCVLPLLNDVPKFEGIRIHAGNTEKDTEGCLLVGTNTDGERVIQSRVALSSLLLKLQDLPKDEQISILISNDVTEVS